jgi:hypothetical protein
VQSRLSRAFFQIRKLVRVKAGLGLSGATSGKPQNGDKSERVAKNEEIAQFTKSE